VNLRELLLDQDILDDDRIQRLTFRQRLLWIGLALIVGKFGRTYAYPTYVRSKVFPFDEIPPEEIAEDLRALEEVGLIYIWRDENGEYLWVHRHNLWEKAIRIVMVQYWDVVEKIVDHRHRSHIKSIDPGGGVYMLWSRNGFLLYVGRTENFQRRLSQHLHGKVEDWEFFSLIYIKSENNRSAFEIEKELIMEFLPPFNYQSKRFRRGEHTDLDRLLAYV